MYFSIQDDNHTILDSCGLCSFNHIDASIYYEKTDDNEWQLFK